MRRVSVLAVVAALASVVFTPSQAGANEGESRGVIPGAYIVTLVDSASPGRVANEHSQEHGAQVSHVYRYALKGYAARMSSTAAARISRDPRVVRVEADRVVSIAAKGKPGGGGGSATQSLPTGIDRIDGDLSSTLSGNGSGSVDVDVAVIDTGIDRDHPDLNVAGGVNCSSGSNYDDGNGHGTHVAGTIGAKDNTIGVVGVAPGARLWAVRVLNNAGSGSWSSVICGVEWVTANSSTIEVANMSLGGSGTPNGCTSGLHLAICNSVAAGVTYAVAAGNDSVDASNSVPASYPEVITVSALADFNGLPGGGAAATCRTDVDDTFADFSNFGADVDIIAPGVCINSTWKGGGYNTISGTSMASPHVAGAAALYLAKATQPQTPEQVRSALVAAGNDGWDNTDDGDGTKEPLLNVKAP